MQKQAYKAKMVRVHCSEKDRWEGKALYEAVVALCMDLGIAGATVYRGMEGFGQSGEIHSSGFWTGSGGLPIVISIVDREDEIARLLPRLEPMICDGIVVMSDVEVVQYRRG